jgi:hypothetical protein
MAKKFNSTVLRKVLLGPLLLILLFLVKMEATRGHSVGLGFNTAVLPEKTKIKETNMHAYLYQPTE